MLLPLPKKGLTLPGHRYCGPGNSLDNGPPTNELDAICMEHDYCYSSNIPKSECDKNMLGKLSSSESKTFVEKIAKFLIVKPVIGTKSNSVWVKKKKKKKKKNRLWSVDLVDMLAFSSFHKGFKYILKVIDVFSKYAWAVPIKDTSGCVCHKSIRNNNK